MVSVKQGGIKYHFLTMARPGIEPQSLVPLADINHNVNGRNDKIEMVPMNL